MTASSVHPPSKRPVATSQMGFTSPFHWLSLVVWPSCRAPSALALNASELRRSRKVSKLNPMMSLPLQRLSRRISVVTISMSESHARAAMYTFSSSNMIQISVWSRAWAPGFGST